MTLYVEESLRDNTTPQLHALIIGVGEYQYLMGGKDPSKKASQFGFRQLTSTVPSAYHIAQWLKNQYNNPDCQLGSIELLLSPQKDEGNDIPIEVPTLDDVRETVHRWKDRCHRNARNIAFFYFAGHGYMDAAGKQFLALSDFLHEPECWNAIDLEGFLLGMRACQAETQMYFIDACRAYNVGALENINPRGESFLTSTVHHKAPGKLSIFYATGEGYEAFAPANGVTFFARGLLESLGGAALINEGQTGDQVITLDSLAASLKKRVAEQHKNQQPTTINGADFVFHVPRANKPAEGRSLEEAMGYATQAFRDYLNKYVVEGVELIYFLSYDVWDGCLLYDGLVPDSIEQRLLNYIRREFLRRDRLRSKFDDLKEDKKRLGAAGRCFKEALDFCKQNNDKSPIDRLYYIGDLEHYPSEYRAFDRLLGLVSCLYIPVVGTLLPSLPGQPEPKPQGGVLMAASRKPYGLRPIRQTESQKEQWQSTIVSGKEIEKMNEGADKEKAKEKSQELDKDISRAIVDQLKSEKRSIEVAKFLKCIGGMYSQKSIPRSGLRRMMHPSFLKKVAERLKHSVSQQKSMKVIEVISSLSSTRVTSENNWFNKCIEDTSLYVENSDVKALPSKLADSGWTGLENTRLRKQKVSL